MIYRHSLKSLVAVLVALALPLGLAVSAHASEPKVHVTTTVPATPAEEADQARITGEFKYVGGAAEQAALNEAIERSIDGFSIFTKGAARTKLREVTSPKAWLRLSFDAGRVVVALPGSLPTMSPTDGSVAWVRGEDGMKAKVAQRLFGRTLVQNVVMEGATSHAEYSLGADDKTLTVRVQLKSDKLNAPIAYTLTYRR